MLHTKSRRATTCSGVSAFVAMFLLLSVALLPAVVRAEVDLDALAIKGQAITNSDPLATDLRSRENDDAGRRGFDIGMAVAEGHTLPGPGKQRIHDSLPSDQQHGFATAVSYTLGRNRSVGGVSPTDVVTPAGRSEGGPVAGQVYQDALSEELKKPPYIGAVTINPAWNLSISFTSTQKSKPVVEICQSPPIKDRNGLLIFPPDSGAISMILSSNTGRYYSDYEVLSGNLEPGKNYYYIINVFNDNLNEGIRKRDQETGRFTMASAGNPPYLCHDNKVRGVDGSISDCYPYMCQAGRCTNSCNSVNDCAPPTLCDTHRACVSQ